MIRDITFKSKKRTTSASRKPLSIYQRNGEEMELVGHYPSQQKAADALGVSIKTISNHLKDKTPYKGMEMYYRGQDPYAVKVGVETDIEPKDDLPVISFFRDDDTPLARYKSVMFLQRCLGRPIKQILEWLKGGHCTDPDCYYKYERDCKKEEIEVLKNH